MYIFGVDISIQSMTCAVCNGFVAISFGEFSTSTIEFTRGQSDVGGVFSIVPPNINFNTSFTETAQVLNVGVFDRRMNSIKMILKGTVEDCTLQPVEPDHHCRSNFHPFQEIRKNIFTVHLMNAVGVGTDSGLHLSVSISLHSLEVEPIMKQQTKFQKVALTGRVVTVHQEAFEVDDVPLDPPVLVDVPTDGSLFAEIQSQANPIECNSFESESAADSTDDDVSLSDVIVKALSVSDVSVDAPRVEEPKRAPPSVRQRKLKSAPHDYPPSRWRGKATHYMMDTSASKSRTLYDLKYLRAYRECDDIAMYGKRLPKSGTKMAVKTTERPLSSVGASLAKDSKSPLEKRKSPKQDPRTAETRTSMAAPHISMAAPHISMAAPHISMDGIANEPCGKHHDVFAPDFLGSAPRVSRVSVVTGRAE